MSREFIIWLLEFVPVTAALEIAQFHAFTHLMECRFDKKTTARLCAVVLIIIHVVCLGGCWIFQMERETLWSFFTLGLPTIVFFFWLSKYRDIRFWVTFCISDIAVSVVDYLVYVICLLPYEGPREFWWSLPVRCVACALAAFLLYRFVRPNYAVALRELDRLSKGWLLMFIVVLFSYVLMGLLASYPTPISERREYIIVSIVAMLLIGTMIAVIAYLIANMLNAQIKSRQENEMALRLQLARQQIDGLRDSVEQTRAMRHDLKHQMQVMQMMCKEGNYDALQEYLQDGISKIDIATPQYCKNYVANLLLQHYATLAARSGVAFRCHANLPEKLNLEDTALTTLLGNALSNALEAAQSSQEIPAEIDMHLSVKQNTLVMKLCNTASIRPQEKDGELVSSKGEGHGYGFASLHHLVEAANGFCQWMYEDGTFRLDVALPLT